LAPRVVGANLNGKKIEVRVGEEIQIELGAIGGTGYSWYFDDLDSDFFDLIDEGTKVIAGEKEGAAGNPVVMIWKLSAKKAGASVLRMSYYRVWEGRKKAVRHFEINVDIAP